MSVAMLLVLLVLEPRNTPSRNQMYILKNKLLNFIFWDMASTNSYGFKLVTAFKMKCYRDYTVEHSECSTAKQSYKKQKNVIKPDQKNRKNKTKQKASKILLEEGRHPPHCPTAAFLQLEQKERPSPSPTSTSSSGTPPCQLHS